jgi:hypothetical protein
MTTELKLMVSILSDIPLEGWQKDKGGKGAAAAIELKVQLMDGNRRLVKDHEVNRFNQNPCSPIALVTSST